MAEFTLTINAQVPPYSDANESTDKENCTDELVTYPVGLQRLVADPTRVYLVQNYTGVGWKTLHLTSISYDVSDFINTGSIFYLEYLGSKVNEGILTIDIDVQSLVDDDLIPDLFIKSDISAGELSTRVITLGYSIEDTNDNDPLPRTNVILSNIITCSTPVDALVSNLSTTTSTPCGSTAQNFSVTVPEGTPVNMRYKVTENGGVHFDGYIHELDAPDGAEVNQVVYMSQVEDNYYNIIYYPVDIPGKEGPLNEIHFRAYICSNAQQTVTTTVEVEVLTNDRSTILDTFYLSHTA